VTRSNVECAVERRTLEASGIEFRAAQEGKPAMVHGYAALFNTPSRLLRDSQGKAYVEVIKPGAFDGLLEGDVRCLVNHEPSLVLGRTTAGTLRLSVDERGLAYECDLPDTACAKDLAVSLKRGDVTQSSFAFNVAAGGAVVRREGGQIIREVRKCSRLTDVSVVTYPAYDDTEASCRSVEVEGDAEPRATDECPSCAAAARQRAAELN